jgi:acid stress chaperone HdeB
LILLASGSNANLVRAIAGLSKGLKKMKRLLIPMLALALFGPVQAKAEKLDLSTISCKRFFDYSKENIGLLLTWLEGYYSGDDDDPVIDFDKMAVNAKKLGEYCAKNPDIGLITAAEKIYGKDDK